MKYLKYFKTNSEYQLFVENKLMIRPTVSFVVETKDVDYFPREIDGDSKTRFSAKDGLFLANGKLFYVQS